MFTITRRLLVLLSFLFIASASYSQDKSIDSLKSALKNPKLHDTTRLRTIALFRDQHYTQQEKSYYYLFRLLGDLAYKNYKNKKTNPPELQKKYTMWMGSYYGSLAVQYFNKPDHAPGLAYFDKSIALHKEAGGYKDMYFAMISKAQLLIKMKEYDKAIPYIFKAIKYFETHRKEVHGEEFAYAYTALGRVYALQGKDREAITNYKKVLTFWDDYDQDNYVNYQKAKIYSRMAESYMVLKNYPEVISYSEKALENAKPMNDKYLRVVDLCRIGLVKIEQAEFDEAERIFNEALALQAPNGTETNEHAFISAYLSMAKLNFRKQDLSKAAMYAEKGLDISQKTNDMLLMTDASTLLYKISLAGKNYKRALEMYQMEQKVGDSTRMESSKNVLAQQLLKYNYEKKEFNLKLAAEKKASIKNNWLIGLSGVLLLFVFGGFFYYRNNKQKQEIAGLEKNQIKQKLLITQMNPHFIFNSIGNIQGLIHDKKDKDAVNYLTKFSKLTRQILENSNENYISLAEEVEMTENYLSIQQLLYPDKFGFRINIENGVDIENIFLPPMLTQPFIENAIKHGVNTTENGQIDIRFYLNDSKLFFEVTDNGKGFDASKKIENHKSLAMTITKERLINYTRNQDFVVHTANIKDSEENVVGAKVSFEIPYIYEN
ncbi:MAG: histidine kinase [Flavobacterium sp.]